MSSSTPEGSLDGDGNRILSIQLPNGKTVEATVDPSLKMMDLLISIASNNKLNPIAYQIAQPSKYKGRPPNVYTPSQSAGDIIGSSIMLVPKKEREQFSIYKGNKKSGVFEHTVRLTIHSSRNHKMVFRTNPGKTLKEVFPDICEERGVDASLYLMRAHKQKVDADLSKTIESFGTLDFDLIEADGENKRKSGIFGKFKRKEDEDEKMEKAKTLPPTSNGSHVKQELPPSETKPPAQTAVDASVPHVPHKKRPAPLPPSAAPPEVQPQVGTTEKSAPKISRVSTKKRRAPPAPPIVVPISIEDAPKEERKTETPNDETDAPVVVDGSNQGVPPSPAVSHGSSQDKDSIIGSVSEQDSADVEGSETSSVNPDRRSMTEDVEEPIESSSSKDDDSTQGQDIVIVTSSAASAEGGGGEGGGGGKENEGKEIEGEVFQVSTSGDGEADNIVGALDASKGGTSTTESEKDQDSKEVVKVSDSREGIENREDVSGNDLQTDEVDGGSDPPSEESRRNVCKCIDPENGEECDHMPGTGQSSCGGHDRPSEDGNDNEAVTSPETTAEDDVKGKHSSPEMNKKMDDNSNETTSYSTLPQEEDLAHEMEDKSLQMSAGLAKVGKSNSGNLVPYQMQTDPLPENVHDLKEMYQQMQQQLIELQRTMLLSQQQQQPTNQGAALQLQQLQQQMLLHQQQQLLAQQGMMPQPMMMPPLMMPQSTPPMVLQMPPQGLVMPPGYMVPTQQPVVMMQQPQAAPAQMVQTGSEESGSIRDVSSMKTEGADAKADGKPSAGAEPQATDEKHNGLEKSDSISEKEPQNTSTKEAVIEQETPPSKPLSTVPQSSPPNEESKTASPSSRRKNVFADIVKKKGKPTSNYVLSAQREMLNRQRSNSDSKSKPASSPPQVSERLETESDLTSKDTDRTQEEEKDKDISTSEKEVASVGKIPVEAETHRKETNNESEKLSTSSQSVSKINGAPASLEIVGQTGDSHPKAQPVNIDNESSTRAKAEGLPPTVMDSSAKHSNNQSNGQPAAEPSNETAVTAEIKTDTNTNESIPKEDKTVLVSSFEPQFADDQSITTQLGGGDATAHMPPKVAPKPARKPVEKPQSREANRPFRRSSRPVSLASDRHGELQQMASLNSVSRFKEVGFQGAVGPRKKPSNAVRSYMQVVNKQMKDRRGQSNVYSSLSSDKQDLLKILEGGLNPAEGVNPDVQVGTAHIQKLVKHDEDSDIYSDDWDTDWDSSSDDNAQ